MRLKADEVEAQLRRRGLAALYFVSGDEPLRRIEIVAAIRDAALAGGHAERVVLYAEAGFDWQALRHHLDSPSLFSATRLIELRLGESGPGVQGSKAIIACAERPPTGDVVLITASGLDAKARQSAWYRALDKSGVVIEVRPVSPAMLPRWIMERAQRLGLTLEHEAAAFLSERVENNSLAANQEIEKLALSAPGGRIGLAELQGAIADNSRYDAFDLVAAALAGRLDQSLKVLRGLRAEGAEPVMILWAILRELRLACRLSWRSGRGEALEALFAEHHIWPARQGPLRDALKRHTSTGLWALLLLAGRAERGIKGMGERHDPWLALDEICMRLAGRG